MSSPRAVSSRDQESITDLLRRLMDELATLFRQELALASSEMSSAMSKLSRGLISVATGGAVLYAGFLTLLAAAVLALALVVEPWLAALIVGGVVTLIGVVMVLKGKKALEPSDLKPRRTVESLRQDKDVLMRREP
jgi:predicted phage tail protein